jgi:hypothetical protein
MIYKGSAKDYKVELQKQIQHTFRKMLWLSLLSALVFSGVARAVVGPGTVTGNTAVHDPTMCKDSSGTYFVFCMP